MLCDSSLRDTIARHLAAFPVRAADSGARAAAVAVAVTDAGFGSQLSGMPSHADWHAGAALVLTRRSLKLRSLDRRVDPSLRLRNRRFAARAAIA